MTAPIPIRTPLGPDTPTELTAAVVALTAAVTALTAALQPTGTDDHAPTTPPPARDAVADQRRPTRQLLRYADGRLLVDLPAQEVIGTAWPSR
ncbi:hypothetical protein [Candidatus Frankia alpina]|uniref:hypothetical protein n=1 Tax=Candidatus Frankia alpina TaxID=2699483 RepID=UPI0013CFC25C|nr:hypothetical protein [Candidatus Frankia alpina]